MQNSANTEHSSVCFRPDENVYDTEVSGLPFYSVFTRALKVTATFGPRDLSDPAFFASHLGPPAHQIPPNYDIGILWQSAVGSIVMVSRVYLLIYGVPLSLSDRKTSEPKHETRGRVRRRIEAQFLKRCPSRRPTSLWSPPPLLVDAMVTSNLAPDTINLLHCPEDINLHTAVIRNRDVSWCPQ